MNFRASFCDPFQKEIIELGSIAEDRIIEKFEGISWAELLRLMSDAKDEDIFYSPSLEIENKDTRHGLVFSAMGDPDNYSFDIFYKRPKKVKSFFGLSEKVKDDYLTDKSGLSKQDAIDCLNALLRNDTDFLANKIGQ